MRNKKNQPNLHYANWLMMLMLINDSIDTSKKEWNVLKNKAANDASTGGDVSIDENSISSCVGDDKKKKQKGKKRKEAGNEVGRYNGNDAFHQKQKRKRTLRYNLDIDMENSAEYTNVSSRLRRRSRSQR